MKKIFRLSRYPLNQLDDLLDKITSYRLVLYILLAEFGLGVIMAMFGHVPFKWLNLLASGAFLVGVSFAANFALSRFFDIAKNKDSDYITGLILALIMTPASTRNDYLVLAGAALAAQLSKYLLVLGRRHILNPAAVGAVVAGLAFHNYASWWIGTAWLTPFVAIGGVMILRKMNRVLMSGAFFLTYLLAMSGVAITRHQSGQIGHEWWLVISTSSLIFFATVMLTEPQTSPYKKSAYYPYALLTAVLSAVTKLRLSPEEALLIGNSLGYILEPTRRLKLTLIEKTKEANGIFSFRFKSSQDLKFNAGQYMEWTLPVSQSDSRGNRRYLTIASAPEEPELMFAIKMPADKASGFKSKLFDLPPGGSILASHPAGSFTLPPGNGKVVLIAGGVGITPFRSMVQHLLLTRQPRPVTLIYAVNDPGEFAFREVWGKAKQSGLKTIYLVTGDNPPPHWGGKTGKLDVKFLKETVPEINSSRFYVSGPYGFVKTVRDELIKAGATSRSIISDYFPGYGA